MVEIEPSFEDMPENSGIFLNSRNGLAQVSVGWQADAFHTGSIEVLWCAGLEEVVQSGLKERTRLKRLLECSKMADEAAAAEKALKAAQNQESHCEVQYMIDNH